MPEHCLQHDDQALVARSREGDAQAFRELFERYQRRIFSLAFGMVRYRENAEELVQEAFIKAYRNLDRFHGNSSFYTWLYRITMNVGIDFLRREKKRSGNVDYDDKLAHHEEVNKGDFPLVSSIGTQTPGRMQSRRELGDQIRSAMNQLSDKHREVIVLREIEGLSYTEIAETLDIRKGTVMSRLHHARQNLQRMLRPYVETGLASREARSSQQEC